METDFKVTIEALTGPNAGRVHEQTIRVETDENGFPLVPVTIDFRAPDPFDGMTDEEKSVQGIIPMGKDPS